MDRASGRRKKRRRELVVFHVRVKHSLYVCVSVRLYVCAVSCRVLQGESGDNRCPAQNKDQNRFRE